MTTVYYCSSCEEKFEDQKLPNIFKTHGCGSSARIVAHDEREDDEE